MLSLNLSSTERRWYFLSYEIQNINGKDYVIIFRASFTRKGKKIYPKNKDALKIKIPKEKFKG